MAKRNESHDHSEARIREHAYRIWEEEGRPEGRAVSHWEKARELAAIEDNRPAANKPRQAGARTKRSHPVEPREPLEHQGAENQPPKRRGRQKTETP